MPTVVLVKYGALTHLLLLFSTPIEQSIMTSGNRDDGDGVGEPTNNADVQRRRQKRYTIQEKASIIWSVALLMERHGMTRSEACEDINITSGMHWAWKKSIDALLEAKKNNIKAKSSHSGRDLSLTQYKQELLKSTRNDFSSSPTFSCWLLIITSVRQQHHL
jgi:hypothetical protein